MKLHSALLAPVNGLANGRKSGEGGVNYGGVYNSRKGTCINIAPPGRFRYFIRDYSKI